MYKKGGLFYTNLTVGNKNTNGSDIWGKVSYFARQNQIRNLSVLQKSDIVKKFSTLQQQQQEQPRGSITSFDRQYWIDLFSGSDKSTLLHEGSHGFLSEVLYFGIKRVVCFIQI